MQELRGGNDHTLGELAALYKDQTAPYGRWERLTLFGALPITSVSACMSLDSAVDSDAMVVFVEQAWSKWEILLRGLGARTKDALTVVNAGTTAALRDALWAPARAPRLV